MTPHRFFITGTDTGVGKTHFTVWLAGQLAAAGYRIGAYKPVCSGAIPSEQGETWEDAERLAAAIGSAWPMERIAPQRFRAPLAPPVAAALEAREVDESLLVSAADWWNGRVDILLVEGAGGWLSPLSQHYTNADLAQKLGAGVILVAGNRLGVINHALLSLASIQQTCRLSGIVLNQLTPAEGGEATGFDPVQSNREEIERRSGIRLWGILSHGERPVFTNGVVELTTKWNELLSIPPR